MSGKNVRFGMGVVAAVSVAVGAAAYVFLRPPTQSAPASAPSVAVATEPSAPAAPRRDAVSASAGASVADLMHKAGQAVAAGRLIQPQGDNAVEFYLAVLEQDPANLAAQDGLREMFPVATGVIEQKINAGQLDEATQVIALLGKADPNNATLTLLRAKFDLKKKQLDREQDKKDQDKALAANPSRTAPAPAAPTAQAAPATAAPPATATVPVPSAPATSAPASTVVSKPVAAPAPATSSAAASTGSSAASRPATLLSRVNPSYPPDAARKRQEGWVEVGFTVDADGHVKDAIVVGANPARVFNDAALRAVQRWVFEPRVEAGKPAAQHVTSRIEFKL